LRAVLLYWLKFCQSHCRHAAYGNTASHVEQRIYSPSVDVINDEFLEMLRCPETSMRLKRGNADLVAQFNRQVAAGQLCNRLGQKLNKLVDGLLLREDGRVGYPIIDDIPILLVDEAVELGGLLEDAAT
jgi:uncharacterized protein YbaR (Trm112 family)